MTEAQIIALINQYIITNGNNEITAAQLNPILLAMLMQPNDKVGDLEDLQTTAQTNIVAAINELVNAASGFAIHAGSADPNVTPPGSFGIGDWYIRNGTSLYQYNGQTWVLLGSVPGNTVVAETFTYTAPGNVFTVANDIGALIDVQIEQGCNYNAYASFVDDEVTISTDVLFGGETVKIIYSI